MRGRNFEDYSKNVLYSIKGLSRGHGWPVLKIMALRDVLHTFEHLRYTAKENVHRRNLYRRKLGQCCWPGCAYNAQLQVHHIVPIKQGGSDDFVNYIVLCKICHYKHRLHSLSDKKKLDLLVYKFYQEKLILGFCSDEMSNEEFQLRLNRSEDRY